MDYEVMMNGTVRIGQMAPDFEAVTTFGNGLYYFLILEILPPYVLLK